MDHADEFDGHGCRPLCAAGDHTVRLSGNRRGRQGLCRDYGMCLSSANRNQRRGGGVCYASASDGRSMLRRLRPACWPSPAPHSAQDQVKSATMDAIKTARPARLRRRHRHPRLRLPGFERRMAGAGHRLLPRHRRCPAGLADQGQVHRHHVQGAVLGAAVGRDRRADPRFRADLHPQHAAWPG